MDKRYEEALERAKAAIKDCGDNLGRKKMIYGIFPELQESEDEKNWKAVLEYIKDDALRVWLEKQKEQKPNIELIQRSWYMEGYHDREFGKEPKWIIKTGEGGPKFEKNEKYGQPFWNDTDMKEARKNLISVCRDWERGEETTLLPIVAVRARYFLEHLTEPKPAESDSIKGGDFISDGKRVFLVLANVKERNLGEAGSAYCESLILGVDGVVYCNGDDFKKYKRATSDERAKFIHDLKVGVKLKEQPVEWSEEDEGNLSFIESLIIAHTVGVKQEQNLLSWLKSLRPQPKNELSEKDKEKFIIDYLVLLGYPIDANGNIPNYSQTFESFKSALVYWLQQNLQKMLANKRIEPEGIRTETLLKDSYIQAYREGIEDSIRELSSQCENNSPQPHWKPSEEQMLELKRAIEEMEKIDSNTASALALLKFDLQNL